MGAVFSIEQFVEFLSYGKEPAEVGIVYVELVVVCDTPHVVVIGWFYFQYTVG